MAEERANNNERKKKAFRVFGIVLSAGIVIGFFYAQYKKTHISTDDAFIEGNIHTVSSKVSGTVKAVYVADNQAVKQGDLLIEIDPSDYKVKLMEASSSLSAEKARLLEVDRKIEAAKAGLELQKANLRLAEVEKKRAEDLYAQEVISRDRYDRALTAYEIAVAQVRAAEEQLRQAESQRVTQSSTIRQKQASAALAELYYQYTRIYAPADGYVTRKAVQIGNHVQPGQPLMAVVSLDDIWVVANFKETQIGRIRPGQQVKIKVDGYPGRVFMGKVDSIMAGTGVAFSLFPAENATGNYVKVVQRIPVKIVFDRGTGTEHVLRVGMSVVPTVIAK